MKLSDVEIHQSIYALLKGEPKVGKSIALASFPDPLEIIDTDHRIKSIAAFYKNKDKKIDYDQPNCYLDIISILTRIYKSCPYKTVALDGLTTTATMMIRNAIDFRPPSTNTTIAGIRMTEIEDFGAEQRGLDNILALMLAIYEKWKINCLVTAHVLEIEKSVRPNVTIKTRQLFTAGKKVAASIPINFNEVYHFQVGRGEDKDIHYTALTRHTGDDWACSILGLPEVIDFTNKSFYDEIKSYIEVKKTS